MVQALASEPIPNPLTWDYVERFNQRWQGLRKGGRLIYATCSSEPDENEAVVDRFLSSHREFARAPELVRVDLERFRTSAGDFRTLPFRDHLEAFFAAMLVKTKDLQ